MVLKLQSLEGLFTFGGLRATSASCLVGTGGARDSACVTSPQGDADTGLGAALGKPLLKGVMTSRISSAEVVSAVGLGEGPGDDNQALPRFTWPPGLGGPTWRRLHVSLTFSELSVGSSGNTGTAFNTLLYTRPCPPPRPPCS